ncbi:MAG: hypothetical protein J6X81_01365 [Muribaculaceae bacterium]|nr:hypothetical protein [Muribaculaceae bacterium]
MMNTDELLKKVYDLEGMLHVTRRLGDATPEIVTDSIRDLISQLQRYVDLDDERDASPTVEEVSPVVEEAHEQEKVQPEEDMMPEPEAVHLPSDDYDADDSFQHEKGEAPPEIFSFQYHEPEKAVQAQQPVSPQRPQEQPSITPPQPPVAAPALISYFTINDRFRFQRELFGGNNQKFTEALLQIQDMSSVHEAEEFLYDELRMDSENELTNEFVNIIARYFKK